MPNQTPKEESGVVTLAPEGTFLADFQKERTDAITEMFDNKYDNGIYPTSVFFARLDKKVADLITLAVQTERERWVQRIPEDGFSISIQGIINKEVVSNRKYVHSLSIHASNGKTLLLEAEACAHEILQALLTPPSN